MTLKIRIGAAWKTVTNSNAVRIRVGGVWKNVARMMIRAKIGDTIGWKVIYENIPQPPPPPPNPDPPPPPPVSLNVTITPTFVSGTKKITTLPPSDVDTNVNAVANVSNGTGPYTYQWVLLSWDSSSAPSILSPTASATKFRQTMTAFGTKNASFRCIVTDSLGNTGSATVNVTFTLTEKEIWDGSTL